ncbi:hypothetical protein CDAR_174641 [Caerostris darwini]|uniref:Uncharacterized protein n=1 Tax=Caerostris darwini TaxID=1538125 RepID=A0AAV4VDQ4_9ARAC|nr:hypothetical protein CDAR_174641 [Caerostris darwini]
MDLRFQLSSEICLLKSSTGEEDALINYFPTTTTIPILNVLALQRFDIKENQLLQQAKDNPGYQSFTFSHPPHSIIFLPETRELKVTTGCFQCRDCTIDLVTCQHLGHQKPTKDGREGLEC